MNAKEYAAQVARLGAWAKDLHAGRRVPFSFVIRCANVNWSTAGGAAWAGQIRLLPEAGGSAIASFTITAVVDGDDTIVTLSLAAPHGISGMPTPPIAGDQVELFYDVHLTPSGGTKQIFMGGGFTVIGGVQV